MIIARWLKVIIMICAPLVIGFLWVASSPKPELFNSDNFSHAVFSRDGQLLRLTLTKDDKYRFYTPLREINSNIIKATLIYEDQYYYQHFGVNIAALLKAFAQTYILHQKRRGASTISMQVAKIIYHLHTRTISGKCKQILRALQLEYHFSKRELLEAYFNYAPYGYNVEGVGAASLLYFHKSSLKLNLPEALTLAVIPQSPQKRRPKTSGNQLLKKARVHLFERWIKRFPIDKKYQSLISLPLNINRVSNQKWIAPHESVYLLQKYPNQLKLVSTINVPIQKQFSEIVKQYIMHKKNIGINNASTILIDADNMQVLAAIGSADFFNKAIQGQVDGMRAKRSPGSALKPFIYSLALQQGLIHPQTHLKDVPMSFGSYNPENFDSDFIGPISAERALITSRNVPAVYLADHLRNLSFYEFLKSVPIHKLREENHYGLALVLGGGEVTMREMAKLYAILLNKGSSFKINDLLSDRLKGGNQLISAEAAFLTVDMLQQAGQPKDIKPEKAIAWKTGTSSAFRDAWAAAVFNHYVLVVWVGDFKGQSNPAFVGRKAALPLLFQLVRGAAHFVEVKPYLRSNYLNVKKVEVCEASGKLPTALCPLTTKTWFIPGVSPIARDNIYREVLIDKKTGLRACHVDKDTTFKVYEFWPSDILALYRIAGIPRNTPPAFRPECSGYQLHVAGMEPIITSPNHALTYLIHNDMQMPLQAVVDTDVKHLYWFVNNRFLGKVDAGKTLFWHAESGRYTFRIVDDHGRVAVTHLQIKKYL